MNPYGKTGELPTSLPMGCTWATEFAAHGNFAMQIRLPTTSIYGNSGQLRRQPTASTNENVGILSSIKYIYIPASNITTQLQVFCCDTAWELDFLTKSSQDAGIPTV